MGWQGSEGGKWASFVIYPLVLLIMPPAVNNTSETRNIVVGTSTPAKFEVQIKLWRKLQNKIRYFFIYFYKYMKLK